MTARYVAPALGGLDAFAYANGYADGKRDKLAGMVAYLEPVFHGVEYVAGYEAAVNA